MKILCALIMLTTALAALPQEQPAFEVISFKIVSDYYPMLDNKNSPFTADNPDFPRTDAEQAQARRRRTDETQSRGKLRTGIRVTGNANWVHLTLKNLAAKPVQIIEWDFAFPRQEGEQITLRYNVVSKVEIKTGAKKTLKQKLPPEARKCQVVDAGGKTLEAVCSKGFEDPTKFKQEMVTIKKIVYADGSAWPRP